MKITLVTLRSVPIRPLALSALLVLFMASSLFASNMDVEAVVNRLGAMKSFKARITLSSAESRKEGELSYQDGRFHLELSDGRIVASNGLVLIVYNPSQMLAGRQDLMPERSGGPGWMLHGFTVESSGTNTVHLVAEQKTHFIQEVNLKWGEDHVLKEIRLMPRGAKGPFTLTLSNVRVVTSFPAGLFSWKPPAGSRTVENPLNESN